MHIITRTFQGRFLLAPSADLNDIVAGILGRAQSLYTRVDLYAIAILSNHLHVMASGPSSQLVPFVGYLKREISRRWGQHPSVQWPGAMWEEGFHATALPTDESQVRCLRYILQQGVKEGLVPRAEQWPGIHSAKHLLSGTPIRGRWLDATAYGRKKDAESRKRKPAAVNKNDYVRQCTVKHTPIPAWSSLNDAERRENIHQILDSIAQEAKQKHRADKSRRARKLGKVSPNKRSQLPPPPWFEERTRMICWASPAHPQVKSYLRRYWEFQFDFRAAADALKRGDPNPVFPPGAFRPSFVEPSMAA